MSKVIFLLLFLFISKISLLAQFNNNRFYYTFLLEKKILIKEFPLKKIIVEKSFKINDSIALELLAIKQHLDSLGEKILFLRNKNEVLNYVELPMIYIDDVRFEKKHNSYYIFSRYSSPGGYYEYYIFESNSRKIYKSEITDCYETIDFTSVNFKKNTFLTNESKK